MYTLKRYMWTSLTPEGNNSIKNTAKEPKTGHPGGDTSLSQDIKRTLHL